MWKFLTPALQIFIGPNTFYHHRYSPTISAGLLTHLAPFFLNLIFSFVDHCAHIYIMFIYLLNKSKNIYPSLARKAKVTFSLLDTTHFVTLYC